MKKNKKLTKEEQDMINDYYYPINYKGKLYWERDCDIQFLAHYCYYNLRLDMGVHILDNMVIYPDGEINYNM